MHKISDITQQVKRLCTGKVTLHRKSIMIDQELLEVPRDVLTSHRSPWNSYIATDYSSWKGTERLQEEVTTSFNISFFPAPLLLRETHLTRFTACPGLSNSNNNNDYKKQKKKTLVTDPQTKLTSSANGRDWNSTLCLAHWYYENTRSRCE